MENEIVSGLRNAIERGASLEKAVQSFINAGYNAEEVRAAGEEISSGASNIVYSEDNTKKENPDKKLPELPKREDIKKLPVIGKENKKSNKALLWVVIVFLVVIFLSSLAFIIYNFVVK
ncbi:hypothetical protein HY450_03640 [Candidatus Pacearchaeota archaeon]|nr:hypothetical protein [Candidatus Pacearchaeota archaeon]